MGISRVQFMPAKLAKISVSVDEGILKWVDQQIENRIYSDRSHAFDVAVHLLMEEAVKKERPPPG
jgi:metal-responsive CopG/Arc/MetJ family transcriptional regulator